MPRSERCLIFPVKEMKTLSEKPLNCDVSTSEDHLWMSLRPLGQEVLAPW